MTTLRSDSLNFHMVVLVLFSLHYDFVHMHDKINYVYIHHELCVACRREINHDAMILRGLAYFNLIVEHLHRLASLHWLVCVNLIDRYRCIYYNTWRFVRGIFLWFFQITMSVVVQMRLKFQIVPVRIFPPY